MLTIRTFLLVCISGMCIGMGSCKNSKQTAKSPNAISVKAFGAKGDGRTNDAAAIQAALRAMPTSGAKLLFEPGTYMLGTGVSIQGKNNFTIEGAGATLIARRGLAKSPQNALLTIENCDNFSVRGIKLDGNRDNRPTALNQVPGHNLRILDVRYADFVNITSINGVQDGFTLQDKRTNPRAVHHVKFINCVARNNFRQGLSVINGSQIDIIGGEYSGTNGVEPQAGIDIEANAGEAPNEDIRFKGVTFRDNAYYGIVLAGANTNSRRMYIDSCFFYGNAHGAILVTLDETEITRCVFEGNSDKKASKSDWIKGTSLIDVKHGLVQSVVIRDNTFRNTSGKFFAMWLSSKVQYAQVIENSFIRMPRTSLAVYAKRAAIIGNTFEEGANRDIQFKGGTGHIVACNKFEGRSRPLMLNEADGTYRAENTFNRNKIPQALLQEKKKLQTVAPAPRKGYRPGTASRSPAPVRRDIKLNTEESVAIDASQPVSITLPSTPGNSVIVIKRTAGNANITLKSSSVAFKSGQQQHTLGATRKVSICYFDGDNWRVY